MREAPNRHEVAKIFFRIFNIVMIFVESCGIMEKATRRGGVYVCNQK